MNKRLGISTNSVLSNIIDQIEETLKCSKFKEFSNLIDVDTWENIKNKMPHNKDLAENGFGFCIGIFFENRDFKRIIVINYGNCNKLNLSDGEITAIIYHELGHLLNNPELAKVPTILDHFESGAEYSVAIAEKTRNNNSLKKELYADSYTKKHGFGEELVSTFEKQNNNFEQKIGFFDERVEAIKNGDIFEGTVAPVDTQGW